MTLLSHFQSLFTKLNKRWYLSKTKGCYAPLLMRSTMRFANIFPCIDWSEKMLNIWDSLDEEVRKELAFLKENAGFIKELVQTAKVFKNLCKKLKDFGFVKKEKESIIKELDGFKCRRQTRCFCREV